MNIKLKVKKLSKYNCGGSFSYISSIWDLNIKFNILLFNI